MTMHEESQSPSFVEDLHEVAMIFEPPNTEFLYGGAVTRGRAIKRRRAFQGAFGAVVALAAAGSLAFALAGGTDGGRAEPSSSASVVWPTATISSQYLLQSVRALLPGDVKANPADPTIYAMSFEINGSDGEWSAMSYMDAIIHGQKERLQISVDRPAYTMMKCALLGNSKIPCTTTALSGGATLVEYSVTMHTNSGMGSEVDVYRNLPSGIDVHLQLQGTAPVDQPVLTASQMRAMVTAPAWDKVIAAVPPKIDCPSGIQPQNSGRGPGWYCTGTGQTYPGGPDSETDGPR